MDINDLQFLLNPFPYVGIEEDGVHLSLEHFPAITYEEVEDVEALDDYVHVTVTDIPNDEHNMIIIGEPTEPSRTGLSPEDISARMEPLRTGLSPQEISARMEPYVSLSGAPSDDRQCCICLDDCHNGKELGKLNCRHEFHYACISMWLLQKNSCPLCKRTALAGEE